MSTTGTTSDSLGPDFPGQGSQFLLRLLLPAGRRDEFVGDLEIEGAARPAASLAAAAGAQDAAQERLSRAVGAKRQAQETVREAAERTGQSESVHHDPHQ